MICDIAQASGQLDASPDKALLVLVDALDRELGYLAKDACHDGEGALHRAFSVFVFNDRDELLLQRRSMEKRLWPGYWSNSCCSHPVAGDRIDRAVTRRVEQELGIHVQGRFLYKFIYQASFDGVGSEHELCHVFWARHNGPPRINDREISAWCWISVEQLSEKIAHSPDSFTPWLRLEWPRLLEDPECPI